MKARREDPASIDACTCLIPEAGANLRSLNIERLFKAIVYVLSIVKPRASSIRQGYDNQQPCKAKA